MKKMKMPQPYCIKPSSFVNGRKAWHDHAWERGGAASALADGKDHLPSLMRLRMSLTTLAMLEEDFILLDTRLQLCRMVE